MTEASDVSIMNKAATQDLRALLIWPTIKQVLATGPAPSKLAEESAERGLPVGRSGRQPATALKRPKAAGAAVMDAIWTPIAEAVLSPVLGEVLPLVRVDQQAPTTTPTPAARPTAAAGTATSTRTCGHCSDTRSPSPTAANTAATATSKRAANSLWAAIQTAAEGVAATQGPTPSTWKAAKVEDRPSRRACCPSTRCAGPTARRSSRSSNSPNTKNRKHPQLAARPAGARALSGRPLVLGGTSAGQRGRVRRGAVRSTATEPPAVTQ